MAQHSFHAAGIGRGEPEIGVAIEQPVGNDDGLEFFHLPEEEDEEEEDP